MKFELYTKPTRPHKVAARAVDSNTVNDDDIVILEHECSDRNEAEMLVSLYYLVQELCRYPDSREEIRKNIGRLDGHV